MAGKQSWPESSWLQDSGCHAGAHVPDADTLCRSAEASFDWSVVGIQQNVIEEAIDQWCKRLRACVGANGVHFEHFLWLLLDANLRNKVLIIVFESGNFYKPVTRTIYCWKLRNLKVFVSQGSAARLTGCGGKFIYCFVANSFRNISTKNHENRLTFVKVIAKVKSMSFFLDHSIDPGSRNQI